MQDCCIRIGGEAGQGLRSIGQLLSQALQVTGYYLFSNQDYESRIRGGHNFYNIRFASEPVLTHANGVDVLVALDRQTIIQHEHDVNPHGVILFDSIIKSVECKEPKRCFAIPFSEIAKKHGHKIMANTAAVAAVWGILDQNLDSVEALLRSTFRAKGEKTVAANIKVAREGYEFAKQNWNNTVHVPPPPKASDSPKILISGNSAVAIGAIAAGVKFMSAYPMSPSTSITEYIAKKGKEFNIVMEQAEDEIAAIVMAIGASYAGVRSMTATSGGGLALMGEAISMAGMNETPVVVINAQRPGPATGLPTRTAQEDLNFAIHLGHGEFPKVVLAPGTHEQLFFLTSRAFNLADRYQCPVIVMTDQYLADSQCTMPPFDFSQVKIDRGELITNNEDTDPNYQRYKITPSGISPRLIPGLSKSLVVACTDEHDETGHLIEDAQTRRMQTEKRMRKLALAREEAPPPTIYGDQNADLGLICWGSLYGAVKEATDYLNDNGTKCKMIHFYHVWPLNPDKVLKAIGTTTRLICVEQNFTGQFAHLLHAETGITCAEQILRYDGRAISFDEIVSKVEKGAN